MGAIQYMVITLTSQIIGHIKAQDVNYYCNGPKDSPVNGVKYLVWFDASET
jgi:hypothetical protein